jgi:hypothetical protein
MKKFMKHTSRILLAVVLGLGVSLAFASVVYAAPLYWTVDTTVTINSNNYTILAGSTATSMINGATTLSVTVSAGESFQLKSSNSYLLTNDQSIASVCSSGGNTLTVGNMPNPTVIITPNATTTCTIPSNGGGGGGGGGGGTVPPSSTVPTASFSASASSITSGQSVTLTWSTTNATSASIDQGIGNVATSSTKVVSPTATTTYTLTATGAGGTVTQSVTITVPGTTPVTPPATSGGAHSNGTLINDNGTFYLIQNGMKIGFRDAKEYASYGYNFGQAVAATAADKDLPSGSVAKAMVGTLVIDASDGRTVYMIGIGSTKRGFVSSAVFKALGYSFVGLPKINLIDYPTGDPISDSNLAHPDGSLVFQGQTIWWLRNGQKSGFESMVVFNTYGFSVSKVLKGNAADFALPEGSIMKLRDGTLVLDGSTYYLISDSKKLAFTSTAQLTEKGYKTANAVKTSLSAYESGGNVQ